MATTWTTEEWHPGSFTKNFSWGSSTGLKELHEVIRAGFAGQLEPVERAVFRERVQPSGRPDYIPINFFLFNRTRGGIDYIEVDELVFQALNFRHSQNFDRLALFAFNLSIVGRWTGAKSYQSRPAMWANRYVASRVAEDANWDTSVVSPDDIENFVRYDSRYRAKTSRKLATNLNHLYRIGRLSDFAVRRIERWWVNALFLTLDRVALERTDRDSPTQEIQLERLLIREGFHQLTGPRTIDKDLAVRHLIRLYVLIGGIDRFSPERVRERQEIRLPDVHWYANNPEPGFAVHPSNPKIAKSLPRICAMLVTLAGFDWVDFAADEDFDVVEYVRNKTRTALSTLASRGIEPTMSAEDLMKLLRD